MNTVACMCVGMDFSMGGGGEFKLDHFKFKCLTVLIALIFCLTLYNYKKCIELDTLLKK